MGCQTGYGDAVKSKLSHSAHVDRSGIDSGLMSPSPGHCGLNISEARSLGVSAAAFSLVCCLLTNGNGKGSLDIYYMSRLQLQTSIIVHDRYYRIYHTNEDSVLSDKRTK